MANLDQIKQLNIKYGKNSALTEETKSYAIIEAFIPGIIVEAISDSIRELGSKFTYYFDLGLPVDVVLLFVDVCRFSTRFANLTGNEIGEYFDEYYDIVIQIIYKYGGEIDKIMGDGIVAIFGPPFQNIDLKENIKKADQCSREIIRKTKNTKFSSKVALHNGKINYFKNKTGLYREYTIIGKPVTELFRLESISFDERINYYDETDIKTFYEEKATPEGTSPNNNWNHHRLQIINLKGVEFKHFFTMNYNKI